MAEGIDEPGGPTDRDVDRALLGSLLAKLPSGYLCVVDDLGRAWNRELDLVDEEERRSHE